MPAIITSKFRFHNAEQFKESFSETTATNYYLFIGRPSAFSSSTGGGTDSAPPTPVDNRTSEAFQWDEMLAAKKIDSTGVTHTIARRDLDTSGATTYDIYRPNYSSSNKSNSNASTLFDSTFYFMTSAYRVYKVLENNGNAAWTASEPTVETPAPFTTSGYTLKYMYKLSSTDIQNFLTPDFIPVPTTAVSGNGLIDGSIVDGAIKITTAGASSHSGTAVAVANVPIRGDGVGGRCTVTVGNTGTVTTVAVAAGGSGYTHANILADDIETMFLSQQGSANAFGTDPVFEVIIGPDGGHGSNPAKELGGYFCMMDIKLQQTESYDFSVVNDFRQVGVVRDPKAYGSSTAYTNSSARMTYAIKMSGVTGGPYTIDEKITQTVAAIASPTYTYSTTTITVATPSAHSLTTGQWVTITGSSDSGSGNVNGTYSIIVTSTTAFTFVIPTSKQPTGTVTGGAYTVEVAEGIVVEHDTTNNILFYTQNSYGNMGTGNTSKTQVPLGGGTAVIGAAGATGTPDTASSATVNNTVFVNGYANPEMQADSGDVIYIENRKPIARASDQTEDIKLIVEF